MKEHDIHLGSIPTFHQSSFLPCASIQCDVGIITIPYFSCLLFKHYKCIITSQSFSCFVARYPDLCPCPVFVSSFLILLTSLVGPQRQDLLTIVSTSCFGLAIFDFRKSGSRLTGRISKMEGRISKMEGKMKKQAHSPGPNFPTFMPFPPLTLPLSLSLLHPIFLTPLSSLLSGM